MSDLAANSCEACRIDAPLVSDDEASVLLKEIEGWQLVDDGVKKLKKNLIFLAIVTQKILQIKLLIWLIKKTIIHKLFWSGVKLQLFGGLIKLKVCIKMILFAQQRQTI